MMAYERGDGSYGQLAALFAVDHRTLERWVARWRTAQLGLAAAARPRVSVADHCEDAVDGDVGHLFFYRLPPHGGITPAATRVIGG